MNPTTARTVVAYALTWDTLTPDKTHGGDDCWVRVRRGALDRWLATRATVPVHASHAEKVGQFVDFRADDRGLLTTAVYDDTPGGQRALDEIRGGRHRAYSCHLIADSSHLTGERHGGLPVYDIDRATLNEAGPTAEPADPTAEILTLAGADVRTAGLTLDDAGDVITMLESITGLRTDDVLNRRADAELNDKWRTQDTVRDVERVALALKKARRQAEVLHAEWRQTRVAATFELYHDAERDAELYDEALRELICHDQRLYDDLRARYGIGPKVTPLARIRGLAA